ncbi:PTS sugar transporter subunit IIB [Bacillus massiliigorillae]|uniref:PTS sugar transporter subunit IIB n=1 Tax=Bacillus massiliigorillae TaxID=1243664 RepID=UPI0003A37CE9|nr:PTS sugar transporter subunit IIB [Bacillus massiliigorillae]
MNIMLVCSAGMSTSMLVTKMQESAQAKGIEATIWAIPEASLQAEVDKSDVILLGPQVRFLKSKIEAVAAPKGIPVEVIDMMNYGAMNGEAVLQQALNMKK